MKKSILLTSLLLTAICSSSSFYLVKAQDVENNNTVETQSKIKNVILFVGDGMGPTHVDAAGLYQGKPLVFDVTDDNWTYHAYSNTDSRTSAGFTLDTSKSLLRIHLYMMECLLLMLQKDQI